MADEKLKFGRFFASLETRLVGALALIVVLTALLQVVTQREAYALRKQGEALIEASAIAENADQFAGAVDKLRMAANRSLMGGGDNASSELTDQAMAIDDQIGKLRSSGMALYTLSEATSPFADLDRHVATILDLGSGKISGRRVMRQVQDRNAAMATFAQQVVVRAHDQRDDAQQVLVSSVERWQMLVFGTGLVTILVVSLALFDILRNILPAIRRMHGNLQSLADGDLDMEVGTFRLKELQALSRPLETFRRNARAVKNLAFSDPATGLPNRRAFHEKVGKLLAQSSDAAYACMVIDIDRFKHVNDDYGHAAGDELVRLIGARVSTLLGADSVVARVGGDEFAVCTPVDNQTCGSEIAMRIVEAVREPLSLGEYAVAVTVSMGVVTVTAGAEPDIDALLRNADMALYASKKGGRNCATAFDPSMARNARSTARWKRTSNSPSSATSCAWSTSRSTRSTTRPAKSRRWCAGATPNWATCHPRPSFPPPSAALMVRLGEWIIERALADFAHWPDMDLSLNLSPLQLQHEGFSGYLLEACRKNGIAPRRVFLEVTESLSIERNTRALLTLNLLRTLGFRIALDDFGTGYSSLSMVKSFKFDRMKLDRSLVMDLGQDPSSVAVLEAAVTMARHVGAEVVAEGISDAHLIGATKNAGCTHLQGYFYSKPIEAGEVPGYFAKLQPDMAAVA